MCPTESCTVPNVRVRIELAVTLLGFTGVNLYILNKSPSSAGWGLCGAIVQLVEETVGVTISLTPEPESMPFTLTYKLCPEVQVPVWGLRAILTVELVKGNPGCICCQLPGVVAVPVAISKTLSYSGTSLSTLINFVIDSSPVTCW